MFGNFVRLIDRSIETLNSEIGGITLTIVHREGEKV